MIGQRYGLGITIAVGTRALAQQCQQLMALRDSQFRLTPGMPFGGEAGLPVLGQGITPATDRAGRGFDVAGELANTPAGI